VRNKHDIRVNNGIEALLVALNTEDPDTRLFSLRSLCNLMMVEENIQRLFSSSGIPIIVRPIKLLLLIIEALHKITNL